MSSPPKLKDLFPALRPELQISLYSRLQTLRIRYLGAALRATIDAEDFDLSALDGELAKYVPSNRLKRAAAASLRGEVFFPVPYLLRKNPSLLGYYRLLCGFSQKEFYKGAYGRVKSWEERGKISPATEDLVVRLCESMIEAASLLFDAIDPLEIQAVGDLQMLTLGAQLRGSRNVDVGQEALEAVAALLRRLLAPYSVTENKRLLSFVNDSGLSVDLRYGSDPDVSVVQKLPSGEERKLVAIEIKGGADYSNVWNRLGEAEKSHRSAKVRGYNELWTITAVDLSKDAVVQAKAKEKTPTTTRFFHLSRILDANSEDAAEFRNHLGSIIGAKLKAY